MLKAALYEIPSTVFRYNIWNLELQMAASTQQEYRSSARTDDVIKSSMTALLFVPRFVRRTYEVKAQLLCSGAGKHAVRSSFSKITRNKILLLRGWRRKRCRYQSNCDGNWNPSVMFITCARLNRTTTPLGVPRFEALTHHQAGSCTHSEYR